MRILLIGEASGVHFYLKRGLQHHGAEVEHALGMEGPHSRADIHLAGRGPGLLRKLERNTLPLLKVLRFRRYDVINFINSITLQPGTYNRYLDLPILRRKARVISHYALGCDELGLIRVHGDRLPYTPCATCLQFDSLLPFDCTRTLYPNHPRGLRLARRYFDMGFSAMIEYDHASRAFEGQPFHRIQFPIDVSRIPFAPAQPRARVNIVHTPTRRGFKGTHIVEAAMELLARQRSDFAFTIVEGLGHDEYIRTMAEADMVIDQVFSQSPGINGLEMLAMGKVVFSGSTALGRSYFDFMRESPIVDAPPVPAQLSAAISAMLDRRDEYAQLAQRGRAYIEANHDHNMVAGLFLESWQAALRQKQAG